MAHPSPAGRRADQVFSGATETSFLDKLILPNSWPNCTIELASPQFTPHATR